MTYPHDEELRRFLEAKRPPSREQIRRAALRIIGEVLKWPEGERHEGMVRRHFGLHPPAPLSSFRRLDPWGFGLPDERDELDFNRIDCTPDVVWPLSYGGIETNPDASWVLRLFMHKTVSAKDARGYAKRFSPYMLRADMAELKDGAFGRFTIYWAWINGQWRVADPKLDGELMDIEGAMMRSSTALALRQRYEWAVSLGLPGSPSVRFATDPTGMKDVFRIRDLPEGRDRREALMGWVCDHWRQDRFDPDVEVYVRKHLRGATKFGWEEFECELLPAQFDIERRDKLIAERRAMHAAGTDRRMRR